MISMAVVTIIILIFALYHQLLLLADSFCSNDAHNRFSFDYGEANWNFYVPHFVLSPLISSNRYLWHGTKTWKYQTDWMALSLLSTVSQSYAHIYSYTVHCTLHWLWCKTALTHTQSVWPTEEKTSKNRLAETLEPHKQNIGAPKLVSRYQIHSLSTLQLSGCCQLTLEAETK